MINQKGLGDVIELAAPRKVKVQARARAQYPLAKVELIYNGRVAATAPLSPDSRSASLEQEVLLERSGWLALRATGPGHPDSPPLYAHTSPIYVALKDAPWRSRADALFFLNWIDELSVMVRARDRVPTADLRRHVQAQLEAARAVYARLAKEGS